MISTNPQQQESDSFPIVGQERSDPFGDTNEAGERITVTRMQVSYLNSTFPVINFILFSKLTTQCVLYLFCIYENEAWRF